MLSKGTLLFHKFKSQSSIYHWENACRKQKLLNWFLQVEPHHHLVCWFASSKFSFFHCMKRRMPELCLAPHIYIYFTTKGTILLPQQEKWEVVSSYALEHDKFLKNTLFCESQPSNMANATNDAMFFLGGGTVY